MPSFSGQLIGVTLVAAFAVFWVAAGARSLPGRWLAALSLLALVVSACLVWRDCRLLTSGFHAAGRFNGGAYGAAVAFESVAIPLAAVLLKRNGKAAYILPAIALIVGFYFFGLVWAFDSAECWWIGGAMCLLSLGTVACLPEKTRRSADGGETRWWDVVVGLGCAVILWLAMSIQF